MNETNHWRRTAAWAVAATGATLLSFPQMSAASAPSIEEYVTPPTLHRLQATVEHTQANYNILKKIGTGFAQGYQVTRATYSYTAPDRVEVHGSAGIFSGTVVYTNTSERADLGFIHHTTDISRDLTKRQTIFVLGLLPQNYLDTVRAQYVGAETADGVPCDVFVLRYVTDQPNDNRRFQVWIARDKHYVVKKRVWDGGNTEHETILYRSPIETLPGVWVPTRVEAYDPEGELGGVAVQKDISAG